MYSLYNEDGFYYGIVKVNKQTLDEIITNKEEWYYDCIIPKKGGSRNLKCLHKGNPLYIIQKNLLNNFFDKIPIADNVYGFIKGYSYKHFLVPHVSKKYFLRIDIKDFFNSINKTNIKSILQIHFKIKDPIVNEKVLNDVIELITLDNVLPQGAVTSPAVSNIVFRPLDIRIQKYCDRLGFTYTRYADDLLFSSDNIIIFKSFFIKFLSKVLMSYGFKFQINYSKMMRCKSRISLNGFVIEKEIRLSRSKMKDIKKVLFLFNKGGRPSNITEYLERLNSEHYLYRKKDNEYFKTKGSLINYLCGYRSFLINCILQESKDCSNLTLTELIKRIETLIIYVLDLN